MVFDNELKEFIHQILYYGVLLSPKYDNPPNSSYYLYYYNIQKLFDLTSYFKTANENGTFH